MIDSVSRAAFSILAGSGLLKRVASRYGMREPHSFARRFVAGETLEEAITAARTLEAQGLTVTVDRLGEQVTERESAMAATRAYIGLIRSMASAGISRNISVKLTQLGLEIDRATSTDNLRRVLDAANDAGFFVRVDMESSEYTAATLETVESIWNIGCRNIGVVIQSCLRRSAGDVTHLNALGMRVRLVKGAYREPRDVAFQDKREVDSQFVELMHALLTDGTSPAIATHDPALIDETRRFADTRGLARDHVEFQLLFGIRRDLQTSLAAAGYPVRIYVPFGQEWFPYFMRRLGERPANVTFVLKNIFREGREE